MTKWFRGAELDRDSRRRDDFDPIGEGARYRLSAAVSVEIWKRVRRGFTDWYSGLFDEEGARRRFHLVAARVARRPGRRIRPAPTKLTRAEGERLRRTDPFWDVFADVHRGKGMSRTAPVHSRAADDLRNELERVLGPLSPHASTAPPLPRTAVAALGHREPEGNEPLEDGHIAPGQATLPTEEATEAFAQDAPFYSATFLTAMRLAANRVPDPRLQPVAPRTIAERPIMDPDAAVPSTPASLLAAMALAEHRVPDQLTKLLSSYARRTASRPAPPPQPAEPAAAVRLPTFSTADPLVVSAETHRDPEHPTTPVEAHRMTTAWSPRERSWLPPTLVQSWLAAPASIVERPAVTLLRREVAPAESGAAQHPAVDEALGRRGAGEPLPERLRQEMEASLGADLRRVRLHTDEIAGAAARTIRARAFTVGEDIFFAPGAFDPDSAAGRELLAHELAHVVQAQRGRVTQGDAGQSRVSDPGEAIEQEAERSARRIAATPRAMPDDDALSPGAAPEHVMQPTPGARTSAVQPASTLLRAPDPTVRDVPLKVPPGGAPIHQIGIVAWDGDPPLRLRSSPSTTEDNAVATLPFNTHVQVIQRFPGDWLLVATLDGKMGFCARAYVWFPPEHKLPEPNAKLHRVEGGEKGAAIAIARRYYGAVADKWGADLRFYVSALGAVNHVAVPDSTDGWKTVHFRESDLIWIPSLPFARSLHGALNSGSPTYQLASTLGVEGALERVGQLLDDFQEAIRLSGKYIPAAVARHVEQSVVSVLESLLWMAVGAVALLAISTAIGAAIGALAGGAGAAPGAAAGFEVGMALLEWIGLGFLVAWIGNALVRIGTSFGAFFSAVWHARGDQKALDQAALAFAEALGTLAGVLIEALIMWAMSVGAPAPCRDSWRKYTAPLPWVHRATQLAGTSIVVVVVIRVPCVVEATRTHSSDRAVDHDRHPRRMRRHERLARFAGLVARSDRARPASSVLEQRSARRGLSGRADRAILGCEELREVRDVALPLGATPVIVVPGVGGERAVAVDGVLERRVLRRVHLVERCADHRDGLPPWSIAAVCAA